MSFLSRICHSSLGRKYLMAISGVALYGFVIIHMLGNLQVFLGYEQMNNYAKILKTNPEFLWVFRFGLFLMAIIHAVTAIQLTIENRRARSISYVQKEPLCATLASRTMAISGVIVLVFVVYHLSHFTIGLTNPEYLRFEDNEGRHDVYRMVVTAFQNPLVTVFYILSVGLLSIHLSHGVQSMFQSLGLRKRAYSKWIEWLAKGSAVGLFIGFSAVPLFVLLGFVK